MILRLFKTSQPISWVIFISIVVFTRIGAFVVFQDFSSTNLAHNNQWHWLSYLATQFPWVSHLLSTLAVLISAFLYNNVTRAIQVVNDQNTYVAFFLSLLVSMWPSNLWLNPFLLSLPLLIASIQVLGTQPKNTIHLRSSFNSALWAGAAAIVFPPNGTFLVIALLITTILYPAKWRNYVLTIIGFYTPIFFYSAFNFLTDHVPEGTPLLGTFLMPDGQHASPLINGGLLLIALASIPMYFKGYSHQIVRTRKLFNIHLLWLLTNGILFFIFSDYNQGPIGYLLFPLTIILSSSQIAIKKWWLSDIFVTLLLGVLVAHYYLTYGLLIAA